MFDGIKEYVAWQKIREKCRTAMKQQNILWRFEIGFPFFWFSDKYFAATCASRLFTKCVFVVVAKDVAVNQSINQSI